MRRDVRSFGNVVNAITHDSSTLGGNSGSAVLDFSDPDPQAPARVVGLHFAGVYLDANYAVPSHDLAQDSRVVDAGVSFAGPRVEPRGDFYGPVWTAADAGEAVAGGGAGAVSTVATPTSTPQAAMQWTIPLHVSVSIGSPVGGGGGTAAAPAIRVSTSGDAGARSPATSQATEGLFSRRSELESVSHVDQFSRASLVAPNPTWKTALSLALASQLAYEPSSAVAATAKTRWGLATCEFIEADDTQCFVASSAGTGSTAAVVVVAFRGTESLGDWLADLNVLSTTHSYGTVHRGFRSAYSVVDARLRAELRKFPGVPVLITGHSLGGALATIAAAEWQGTFDVRWIYTYGQPAVGKGRFPAFMAQHYGSRLIRVVNDDDIVPQVPPTYDHVGRSIPFDANGNAPELESAANEALAESPVLAAAAGPPVMSETEFDQLRARLLAERAVRRSGVVTEGIAVPQLEGIFPSFSDHKMDNYIAKLARRAGV